MEEFSLAVSIFWIIYIWLCRTCWHVWWHMGFDCAVCAFRSFHIPRDECTYVLCDQAC